MTDEQDEPLEPTPLAVEPDSPPVPVVPPSEPAPEPEPPPVIDEPAAIELPSRKFRVFLRHASPSKRVPRFVVIDAVDEADARRLFAKLYGFNDPNACDLTITPVE